MTRKKIKNYSSNESANISEQIYVIVLNQSDNITQFISGSIEVPVGSVYIPWVIHPLLAKIFWKKEDAQKFIREKEIAGVQIKKISITTHLEGS